MAGFVDQRTVQPDDADIRLDRWFQRYFPNLIHGHLAKLLRTGQVRVDGKRAAGNTRLQAGQIIRIPPLGTAATDQAERHARAPLKKADAKNIADKIAALVLYADDDVLVINKPAGLAVQGGTGIKESLDDWLSAWQQGRQRPKLVHRLDKETSGCLVLALNTFSANRLTAAFRGRDVQKTYVALAHGRPPQAAGEILAPLLKKGQRMVVDAAGDVAISNYRLLGHHAAANVAALALQPYTGRTHQLRVHAAHVGCPLLGDAFYGDRAADKAHGIKALHLHSQRVQIPHPRNPERVIDVSAPLPMLQQATWQKFGFSLNFNSAGEC